MGHSKRHCLAHVLNAIHHHGKHGVGVHWNDWCWSWNSITLATSCEELTHWKRLWCWEGLGAGGEGDDRGWDGWMASPTWWTGVWVNSGSWWWTGRPDVLRFMQSQRIGHDWLTELNWTEMNFHPLLERGYMWAVSVSELKYLMSVIKLETSLVAQMVKHLSTMWETWVWSLGGEDLLEKEMATHSSFLAWKIPWMEAPNRLQSMESQRVGHDWATELNWRYCSFYVSVLPQKSQNWDLSGLPVLYPSWSLWPRWWHMC